MTIHNSAVIHPEAHIDPTAEIGPFCVVEQGVIIGPRTRLLSHVHVCSGSTLGADNRVHPFAVIGDAPQDVAHRGAASFTRIGDGNTIREGVTIHRGTEADSATTVGHHCMLMVHAHIAHNCTIGDHVILANAALVAGRVTIGARAFISAGAALHQFVRVGEFAMVSGLLRIPQDIAPFMTFGPYGIAGPNVVGLRRNGFTPEERLELRELYRFIFRSQGRFQERLAAAEAHHAPGRRLLAFLREPSKRGVAGYRRTREPEPNEDSS